MALVSLETEEEWNFIRFIMINKPKLTVIVRLFQSIHATNVFFEIENNFAYFLPLNDVRNLDFV